LFIQERT